ncbi:hypothetical protein IKE_05811 [Bacillus cereus VD196]|uniref:Uncharacterized protein n=1 Tax=Bacillus cereus VD196 TaxID=1053243 RepID=A0A9W5PYN9_BACCE|nr:hypothetical protein [Bacillus cereus]EOO62021.1 hypothetical protein IKE_05811 [Bacillus cereus VD196]
MNPDQQSVLRDIQGLPPEVNIKALLIAMHTKEGFAPSHVNIDEINIKTKSMKTGEATNTHPGKLNFNMGGTSYLKNDTGKELPLTTVLMSEAKTDTLMVTNTHGIKVDFTQVATISSRDYCRNYYRY